VVGSKILYEIVQKIFIFGINSLILLSNSHFKEMPNFLSSNLWPLNSPDLSPVDYKIWAVMQHRVYIPQTNPWAIVWMGGSSMSGAVSNRRLLKRLLTSGKEDIKRVSVYAKGGHFEYSL